MHIILVNKISILSTLFHLKYIHVYMCCDSKYRQKKIFWMISDSFKDNLNFYGKHAKGFHIQIILYHYHVIYAIWLNEKMFYSVRDISMSMNLWFLAKLNEVHVYCLGHNKQGVDNKVFLLPESVKDRRSSILTPVFLNTITNSLWLDIMHAIIQIMAIAVI